MTALAAIGWPTQNLGEALEALVRTSRIGTVASVPAPPPALAGASLERWLEGTLRALEVEAEPVTTSYAGVEALLESAGPALVHIDNDGEGRFLLCLGGRRGRLTLLSPELGRVRVRARDVAAELRAPHEREAAPRVDALLDAARVAEPKRSRVRAALLESQLTVPVGGVWLVRSSPRQSLWRRMRHAGLLGTGAFLGAAYAAAYLLHLGAWLVVGRSVLGGELEAGRLGAWALLLLSSVPLLLLVSWLQGRFAIGLGTLLKQRLLYGVLRLEPDETRHLGAGRLLGQVLESDAIESLGLGGGVAALLAAVELVVAAWVLGVGAGGAPAVAVLVAWLGFALWLGRRYWRRRRVWVAARIELTELLIDRMVGHRTRQAQLPRTAWHDGEDEALDLYLERGRAMDEELRRLMVTVPRGWMLAGLCTLAPSFASGSTGAASMAVAIGGVWLTHAALAKVIAGLAQLSGAAIAWEQIGFVYRAGARPERGGIPLAALARDGVLIDARAIGYRHAGGREVLRGCDVSIADGDRWLLEGPSGAGKSTLAAVLAGLRDPSSGLLLHRGCDRSTLGAEEWRRRVAVAPQFHENHVFTGSLAYNLLMGRSWPPTALDLRDAETICGELGLAPLLDRMPAGMLQMVGESGWQLSHGEKSRLYLARALLQRAELVVLDESFAALDPAAMQQALGCVLRRAPALLVIAHP